MPSPDTLLAVQVRAGGEKVAFPENYASGTLYATVDRYDNKQYRELWATPASAVDAARKGEPIPSGTVLTLIQYKAQVDAQGNPVKDAKGRFIKGDLIAYTVMEKRTGWGTEYPDDVRNGEWEYQAFTADKKVNDKANLKGCFQCHKPHDRAGLRDLAREPQGHAGRRDGEAAARPRRGEHRGFPVRTGEGDRGGRRDPSPGSTPTARRTRSRSPAPSRSAPPSCSRARARS